MKLFGGSASVVLAERMGKALDISVFPVDQHVFPDGERRIRITEPVVGENVVVVQSACPPVDQLHGAFLSFRCRQKVRRRIHDCGYSVFWLPAPGSHLPGR